jgi:Recombinase
LRSYEILSHEAEVVQKVFGLYTEAGLSINGIARRLNEQNGAVQQCGPCFATPLIKGWLALAKPNEPKGRRSPGLCAGEAVILHAAAPIENALEMNGLKFRYLHLSANTLLHWHKNNWKK